MRKGIDHVGADAEEPQLEHLEEPAGTGADDHDFRAEGGGSLQGKTCLSRPKKGRAF
jgi:hypothetical protein